MLILIQSDWVDAFLTDSQVKLLMSDQRLLEAMGESEKPSPWFGESLKPEHGDEGCEMNNKTVRE